MKLKRSDLIIEKSETGQYCLTCPFNQMGQTCLIDTENYSLYQRVNVILHGDRANFCDNHTITLKK